MGVEILIREDKKSIAVPRLESPRFRAPDGSLLSLYRPQTKEGFEAAWKVLEDYTARGAPTSQAKKRLLEDLDALDDVARYHFGKHWGYNLFAAVDKNHKPQGVIVTDIEKVSDWSGKKIAENKGVGFLYQVAHTPEVSRNDTDFSVITKLYQNAEGVLTQISKYKGEDWLGVVTESRSSGKELEAILAAGFEVLVPNKFYRPPATRGRGATKDLVLLAKGVPQDAALKQLAADAYVRSAYSEGQNTKPALDLTRKYFPQKVTRGR